MTDVKELLPMEAKGLRWSLQNPHEDDGVGLLTDDQGDWVLYADYVVLATRITKLEELIVDLKTVINLQNWLKYIPPSTY